MSDCIYLVAGFWRTLRRGYRTCKPDLCEVLPVVYRRYYSLPRYLGKDGVEGRRSGFGAFSRRRCSLSQVPCFLRFYAFLPAFPISSSVNYFPAECARSHKAILEVTMYLHEALRVPSWLVAD